MKKLLFISNICSNISNFHLTSLYAAKSLGYEFYFAANFDNMPEYIPERYPEIHFCHIDFIRYPFSKGNCKAYRQLNRLIKKEKFDAIHCNTPIGGALGRLCGYKNKVKKIIYTAHGFHFYKGAPLINNLIYKSIEGWLAHYTDALITMNEEDYKNAKKMRLRNKGKVYKVNGVGIDVDAYNNNIIVNKDEYRKEIGLNKDDFVCIAMGDLIKRKNYPTAIKAIAKCNKSKIHYLICGEGPEKERLAALACELKIENQIHFLGYRSDIRELLAMSDCFLFTSLQEGLPRSLMEAMASGLPCIVSKIRGNVDLIESNLNGYLYEPNDIEGFTKGLLDIFENRKKINNMVKISLKKINNYDNEKVKLDIKKIYASVLESSNIWRNDK